MAPTGLLEVSSASRLSEMEDEQVVAQARDGSSEAAEFLLKKYRSFVEVKARPYYLNGAEREDVVQEGMIGLYKAIRDFQCDKLVQFRSFAELCVTRQIISAVKSATRNKHSMLNDCVSLQQSCGEDGDGCLMDMVADSRVANPENILFERRAVQFLHGQALEDLSELEIEVLQGYLEGKSYLEMAETLDKPSKTVDNALQRAKRKVGRKLCELN